MIERLTACQQMAESFYQQITGKKETIPVSYSPYSDFAACIPRLKTIQIHPFYALSPEDLPDCLKVEDSNDFKLKLKDYFPRLQNWIAKEFKIAKEELSGLSAEFNFSLRLWKDRPLYERIKKFALAHEVVHIAKQHIPGKWNTYCTIAYSIYWTIVCICLCPFYFILPSILVLIHLSSRFFRSLRDFSEQKDELEADRIALQITKDPQAAKAFFTLLKESEQKEWATASFWQKLYIYLFRTERLFSISHPSSDKRIQNLGKPAI